MLINFHSGACAGKSTIAAWLFSELKLRHYNVELCQEYIKGWAWLKIVPQSWDSFYVFAKQLRAIDICARHKVHVITDSPLLMQVAYMELNNCPFVDDVINLCQKYEKENPSINFFLNRSVPYAEQGRYENYLEAVKMDNMIKALLDREKISYKTVNPIDDKEFILENILNNEAIGI